MIKLVDHTLGAQQSTYPCSPLTIKKRKRTREYKHLMDILFEWKTSSRCMIRVNLICSWPLQALFCMQLTFWEQCFVSCSSIPPLPPSPSSQGATKIGLHILRLWLHCYFPAQTLPFFFVPIILFDPFLYYGCWDKKCDCSLLITMQGMDCNNCFVYCNVQH